ncbi:MAG: hypothetical protein ACXAEN_26860 [Candidatus Thorarchaeota archaeon]
MKLFTLTLVVLTALLSWSVPADAQVIVTSAYKLAWDNTNEAGATDSTRVYLDRNAGIVPDGTSFVANVAEGVNEWPISTQRGRWYAVATFAYTDMDGNPRETGPSNEETFIVVGPPGNLRIVPPAVAEALYFPNMNPIVFGSLFNFAQQLNFPQQEGKERSE